MSKYTTPPCLSLAGAVLVLLNALCTHATDTSDNLLVNGGFETTPRPSGAVIKGTVATGWLDDSAWADVSVTYSEDTTTFRTGKASQRIDIHEVRSGAVQFAQKLTLTKDRAYIATLWLRGTGNGSVSLGLRQFNSPWKTYTSLRHDLDDEWQQVQLRYVAVADEPTYLMLTASSPCTIWLDDATVEDITDKNLGTPPQLGNLMPNGSFENGLTSGWGLRLRPNGGLPYPHIQDLSADPRGTIDTSTATHGSSSFSIAIPPKSSALISSPKVNCNGNRTHTFSIALKASRPNAGVELEIEGTKARKEVRVNTEWQRYSISGRQPFEGPTRIWLRMNNGSIPTTFWLDAAQLEETDAASPDYQPHFPLELALTTSKPGNIFFDADPAELTISTSGTLPASAQLQLATTDLYSQTLKLPPIALPATTITIPPHPQHPRGLFKVSATIVDDAGTPISATIDKIFARLPKPRDLDPAKSFFGGHVNTLPETIAIARATGTRWIRLHDTSSITKWAHVENKPDQFLFHDEEIDAVREAGLCILGMLCGAPAWVSTKPNQPHGSYNVPDTPDAMERWTNYITKTVTHYKGRIDNWEIWNEAWGSYFLNLPADQRGPFYGKLLKHAYPAAKAANSAAFIVGMVTALEYDKFSTAALEVAGVNSMDAFSYHDYSRTLYGGNNNRAFHQASHFASLQEPFGTPRPLWCTESSADKIASFYGWEPGNGLAPRRQCAQVIRADTSMIAAGVERAFYYTLQSDSPSESVGWNALEHDRSIRPVMAARAILASMIDGATYLGHKALLPGVDAFAFRQNDNTRITIIWSHDNNDHTLNFPAKTKVLDLLGNPITPTEKLTITHEPLYLIQP